MFARPISEAAFICYHIFSCLSTTNFIFSFFIFSNIFPNKMSGERGIWTLAPRKRPIPLAGAPLQPLEYFSTTELYVQYFICASNAFTILSYVFLFVNTFFNFFHIFLLQSHISYFLENLWLLLQVDSLPLIFLLPRFLNHHMQ